MFVVFTSMVSFTCDAVVLRGICMTLNADDSVVSRWKLQFSRYETDVSSSPMGVIIGLNVLDCTLSDSTLPNVNDFCSPNRPFERIG